MMKPLSPTQLQILTSAAQHPARLAEAPPNLPVAARNAVFQSMLRAGLLEEVPGDEGTVLRITEIGLAAAGAADATEPAEEATLGAQKNTEGRLAGIGASQGPMAPAEPAAPKPRTSLRDAATALLVAWDAGLERPALPTTIEVLRTALMRGGTTRPPRDPAASRTPREGTK